MGNPRREPACRDALHHDVTSTDVRVTDMPFYTELPDGFITLDVDGDVVIDTGGVYALNQFSDSNEFDEFDVPGDRGAGVTVNTGEPISLLDTDDTDGADDPSQASLDGTYLGDAQFSTAGVTLLGIEVEVNPINGSLFLAEDGTFYIVTDDPIREDGAASPRLGRYGFCPHPLTAVHHQRNVSIVRQQQILLRDDYITD